LFDGYIARGICVPLFNEQTLKIIYMESNGNGTVNIHLNKLKDTSVVDVRGRKCVVIPVDDNGIYISEKGTIVLSYFMSKLPEEKWGKTHMLKRKLTKDEYKSWTKEQKDNNPVAGYFEPWKPREGGYANNNYTPQTPATPSYNNNVGIGSSDDLSDMPF
jgi:hypothetical protein